MGVDNAMRHRHALNERKDDLYETPAGETGADAPPATLVETSAECVRMGVPGEAPRASFISATPTDYCRRRSRGRIPP